MRQERVQQKPVRKSVSWRTEQDQEDGGRGRPEVRGDVRKTWWPEG